jgi:predicted N-acetyltransferase YhbS
MQRTNAAIRAERTGDAAGIRDVHDAAFGGPAEGAIVDGIRGTERWIPDGSIVAESADGRLVGHLLISRGDLVVPDGGSLPIWLIGPVAVHPSRQRQGIGTALMDRAIELAVERGQPALCLLGHAGFYRRFGFEPARPLGIEPPRPWADEYWLALRLPTWTDAVHGTVRYPPAFGV